MKFAHVLPLLIGIIVFVALIPLITASVNRYAESPTTTTVEHQYIYVGIYKGSGDYTPLYNGENELMLDLLASPWSGFATVGDLRDYIAANFDDVLPVDYEWSMNRCVCSTGTDDTFNTDIPLTEGMIIVFGYHAYLPD